MIAQIGQLLVETVFSLIIYLLLARFWMQALRAPFRNPIGTFVVTLTNWAVRPVRRVVPGFAGVDLSSILLAWLAESLKIMLIYWLRGLVPGVAAVIAVGAVATLRDSIYLLIGVILVQVVLSWVSPYNDMQGVLNAMTRPFYRMFQRFIPPIGSIDLSPLFVLLLAQIGLIVIGGLEGAVLRLF